MSKIVGRSLPVSTKFSVEICNFIRKKKVEDAKQILSKVADGKMAIPFKRFNRDLSHKKGMGPGRFPKKAVEEILQLLESVEANAQFKGINTADLYISHICAHLASRPWRYGRQRRRKAKRTHIEIVVQEKKVVKEGIEEKKTTPKKKEVKDQKDIQEKENLQEKKVKSKE